MDGSGTTDRVDRAALSPGVSTAGATHTREVDPLTVTKRLQAEGRWFGQVEHERDEMMKLAKKRFPDKPERQLFVYSELARLYPPLAPKHIFVPLLHRRRRLQLLQPPPHARTQTTRKIAAAVEAAWLRILGEQLPQLSEVLGALPLLCHTRQGDGL